MRIAILHPVPAPYREKLFAALARTSGIDLKVYYCGTGQNYRDWRFATENYPQEILPGLILKGFFFNPRILQRLIRSRPDFLLVWGWSYPTAILAFLAARLMKITLLMVTDSAFSSLQQGKNPFSTIIGMLKRCLVRLPQLFLAQSILAQDYLISLGASPKRIIQIPLNCIDVDYWRLRSTAARREAKKLKGKLGIQGKRIILYMGRLIPGKGLETLLEAYGELTQHFKGGVALLIVGGGPLQGVLESQCRSLGLSQISFLGSQPYEELAKYYGISDCLAFPTYLDQWGMVVLEALACGLPVVTTDRCGSAPDLILGRDTGLVVKHGDPKSLAQALSEILDVSVNTLSTWRKEAFDVVDKYDVKEATEKLIRILQSISKSRLKTS